MNSFQRKLHAFDTKQRQKRWLGFPYAVYKKYNQDQAGYQAALLTYYGFLALFPLLLVLTTVLSLTVGHEHHIQGTIVKSITNYFPMLGSQLSANVHSLHKTGVALAVGLLLTFYGVHGVADVFRHGVNHIWQVPVSKRDGFPKSTGKSFLLIIVGGIGFIIASLCAGYAAGVGYGIGFRLLSLAVNIFILFLLFSFMINVSLPRHVSLKETRAGAISAAIGLVILQSLGSYLLRRELKSLDALYSTFALALGLLYWIYLQAQVLYYSVEIAYVSSRKLWPRGIFADPPTAADTRILKQQLPQEDL